MHAFIVHKPMVMFRYKHFVLEIYHVPAYFRLKLAAHSFFTSVVSRTINIESAYNVLVFNPFPLGIVQKVQHRTKTVQYKQFHKVTTCF